MIKLATAFNLGIRK